MRHSLSCLLLALFAIMMPGADASDPPPDFSGHYALADAKSGRAFTLEVKQVKTRAEITFSAAMTNGGASPDGTGKGHVDDGVLSFKFKDSYNNEGTCTLQSAKGGYQLSMVVTKVVAPEPLHFYGNVLLKKVAGH